MVDAAYDEIADWYEHEFLVAGDPIGVDGSLRELLGDGGVDRPCLEIGCGTGVHAATMREMGWRPLGIDISPGMLRYATSRLPVVLANAEQLPIRDRSLSAVITMMAHTDLPNYPAVLREAGRVLRPGGGIRARRRPSVFLRRVRRSRRPAGGCYPSGISGQPLDQAVLD